MYSEPLVLPAHLHEGMSGDTVASEPAYTSFHGTKGVTVDYIWVSPQVQVVGVWEVLATPLLEVPHSHLANGKWPVYLQKCPASPQQCFISKPYLFAKEPVFFSNEPFAKRPVMTM
mmetsp:Transcript_78310/g.114683  ORF Transcript_78310/g.114683 Transcript_78310/m.114683 type:complete len:116 (+) Transcript_78310:47-394(+)